METDINIKSTDNNDNSRENLQTRDYLESIMNEISSNRIFVEEAKLDEERKLQGFPLSLESQILKNKTQ